MQRIYRNFSSNLIRKNISSLVPPSPSYEASEPLHVTAQNVDASILMSYSLHLGHNTSQWNPYMLQYIYGSRHGVHIINLDETIAALRRSAAFVKEVARNGGNVLFVGTRPALHGIVISVAKENDAYFCTHWVGGLLTNKERVLRRSVG